MPFISGTLATAVTLTTSRGRAISVAAGAFEVALAQDELDAIGDTISSLIASGNLTGFKTSGDSVEEQGDIAQVSVALRWLYAKGKPTVHMHVDLEGLLAFANLATNADNATQNARCAVLKSAWNAHVAGVGTIAANGEHLAADATNTIADATPTNTSTRITWIAHAKAAIIGHGNQSGVHFTSDTGSGGTGFTLTTDPPVTDVDCANDLNDVLTAMKTHFNLGTAALPFPDVE